MKRASRPVRQPAAPAAGHTAGDEAERRAALGALVAAFAHEARTPLAYVRSTVDLVRSDLDRLSGDDLRAMLGRISRGTVWMENLVENLAASISLDAGRLALRRGAVPLRPLLEEAIALVEPLLDRRGQRVVLRCGSAPLLVEGDETRLGQVFVNLLVNAHKYSPPDDVFVIRASANGGWVRIRVEDNGPGIPLEEQRRIFEPYTRGRDAAQRCSGLGLGLSIARALVEAHGGAIGLRSTPGRGATFVVTLPLLDAASAATTAG